MGALRSAGSSLPGCGRGESPRSLRYRRGVPLEPFIYTAFGGPGAAGW